MHSNRDKLVSAASGQRLASVVGGAMLIGSAFNRNSSNRFLKAAVGCYLAYKGIAGKRSFSEVYNSIEKVAAGRTLNIKATITVNRPKEEVYAAWRNLSNLPMFMKHLQRVEEQDELYSNWVMELPGHLGTIQWHAEIVKEREGEMIAWQSLPGSSIENAGKVGFRDALGGEGTIVDVVLTYHAPLGRAGEQVARLFTPVFKRMLEEEIQGFKDFVETQTAILIVR